METLKDIENELREQASGSQDGHLLDIADRLRAAAIAERKRCALVAEKEADLMIIIGNGHPENSPSRDRCFARAQTAQGIANDIMALR